VSNCGTHWLMTPQADLSAAKIANRQFPWTTALPQPLASPRHITQPMRHL
jgi:hypothetical protein